MSTAYRNAARRNLGYLGASSADIYNQVISQGGTPSEAEAAARSGSLSTFNQSVQPTQPQWFRDLYYAAKPNVTFSSDGVAPYLDLSNDQLSFAGVPWPTAILNPHKTTALNWVQPDVINKGSPRSLYDPVEFLRSALIDSDWDRVFYWFAFQYSQLYAKYSNSRDAFYPFANMNILAYKYIIDDTGAKKYFPFSQYDLWQFISRIVANFSITDLGAHAKCAIGLLNWGDPYHVVPYDVQNELTGPNQWWNAINQGLLDSQHPSSVFQYTSLQQSVVDAQLPRSAYSPIDDIRVGWIQAPKGPWTFDKVLSVIVIAIVAYYAGAALGAAFSAVFGTTTATAGVTTAGTIAMTGGEGAAAGSAAGGAGAVAGTALDEVVITGTVSTGAVLSTTGAIVAAASVPVAVASSAAAPSSALDEVTITGHAPAVSTLSNAGAVTAVATVPVTVASTSASNTTTPSDAIDEVTITGHAPEVSAVSNAGVITAVASVPVTAAAVGDSLDEVVVTGTTTPATTTSTPGAITSSAAATIAASSASQSSTQNTSQNSQQNNQKSWEDYLKALVKKYGLAYVQKYLGSLLAKKLGRQPTASELQQFTDMLNSDAVSGGGGSGMTGLLIALAGLGVILMGNRQ
jgi:hypothetical protein